MRTRRGLLQEDAEIMARESNQLEMFKEVAPAAVANAISVLAAVKNWSDVREMEKVVIALGLNNENLREQPPELASSFGTGLHLWQYPIQMGRYLSFLAAHAEANSYVEIGSRWGSIEDACSSTHTCSISAASNAA